MEAGGRRSDWSAFSLISLPSTIESSPSFSLFLTISARACVYMDEERERKREGGREGGRERERERADQILETRVSFRRGAEVFCCPLKNYHNPYKLYK